MEKGETPTAESPSIHESCDRLIMNHEGKWRWTECRGRVVRTPVSYTGGPEFKSRPETGYPDWKFSSVPPGKCRCALNYGNGVGQSVGYSVQLRIGRLVFDPQQGPTQPPIQWVPGVLSPGVTWDRGVTLTTHPHLVPRLSMSRSCRLLFPPPPSSAFTAYRGTAFLHQQGRWVKGNKHLWNIGQFQWDYTAQHPRRQSSSQVYFTLNYTTTAYFYILFNSIFTNYSIIGRCIIWVINSIVK
jgi:hypothetical protein